MLKRRPSTTHSKLIRELSETLFCLPFHQYVWEKNKQIEIVLFLFGLQKFSPVYTACHLKLLLIGSKGFYIFIVGSDAIAIEKALLQNSISQFAQ